MDSFEIGRLTDFDFEAICKDIFEEILGVRLEIFAPGADGGVDLRHLKKDRSSSVIVQCKHWMRSGRGKFLSKMRTEELPKVSRLVPSRYIVATSVELTKAAKDSLLADFTPYIQSSDDIYGLHEIEGELRKRPHIVQRHPRLWLNSTAVLQSLMAKEVLLRSSALVEDLGRSLESYVPNDSLTRAQEILDQEHVVVISGAPGIGKTTLAQVLAATHIAQGFDLVEISEDAEEANKLWIDDQPQIFYYDDFLGQTNLADKLNKNEDSRLLGLFRRIKVAGNKRFVLTTREYILNQARHRYERLARSDFSPMACVLDLTNYTNPIRAQILYNHIFLSVLSEESRAIFADPDVYRPIINHRGFNPRIVNLSLASFEAGEVPERAAKRLLDDLENPDRIWQHIIEHQLDDASVALLEVLFSLWIEPSFEALKNAWQGYRALEGKVENLRRSIQILEGSLVKIAIDRRQQQRIDFSNPSLRDYMREYVSVRPEIISNLLNRAVYFEQIYSLWNIGSLRGGGRIRAELCADPEALCEAVVRTLAGPHPRYKHGCNLVDRADTALEIAEYLKSAELAQVIDELALDGLNFGLEAEDDDNVVSLISALAVSQFEPLRHRAVDLIDGAISHIVADISTWDNLVFAVAMLAELKAVHQDVIKHSAAVALEYVEHKMHQMAVESFERWSRHLDEALESPSSEMEDIVDYASQYLNAGQVFESYDIIASHVANRENERRRSSSSSGIHVSGESTSIGQILGHLRNGRSST